MSLSVVGATFQSIFRNPLVSPNILGASSASAFGIALGIVLHINYQLIVVISFILGITAVLPFHIILVQSLEMTEC